MKRIIRRARKTTDPIALRTRLEDARIARVHLNAAIFLLKDAPHARERVKGTLKSVAGAINHAERMLSQAVRS